MRLLRIVADETNIPFMRFRKLFIAISSLAVVLSVVLVLVKGMNFGIDFQGGILIEVRMPQAADMGKMRGQLGGLGLGEVSLLAQLIGTLFAIVIALAFGFTVYKILDKTVGIRLSKEEEQRGSDLAIHNIESNPEDATTRF